jgi:hypothetical protein
MRFLRQALIFGVLALATPLANSANRTAGELSATEARSLIDDWMQLSPRRVREVFGQERRNPQWKALKALTESGRIDRNLLGRILRNPFLTADIDKVIESLWILADVDGVDGLVRRLASSGDPGMAVGSVFEVRAAARLRPYLTAISVPVNGEETDALLTDGTAVEMKYFGKLKNARLVVLRGTRQLAVRGAATGRGVMLVTNHDLADSHFRNYVAKRLGPKAELIGFDRLGLYTNGFSNGWGQSKVKRRSERFNPNRLPDNRRARNKSARRW